MTDSDCSLEIFSAVRIFIYKIFRYSFNGSNLLHYNNCVVVEVRLDDDQSLDIFTTSVEKFEYKCIDF